MRSVAMLLFTLALVKVGIIQHVRQEGARDVVVAAYGSKAIDACDRVGAGLKLAAIARNDIQMQVGDRSRSVALWQVDHADWINQYRTVFLVVSLPDGLGCRYDVGTGTATVLGKKS